MALVHCGTLLLLLLLQRSSPFCSASCLLFQDSLWSCARPLSPTNPTRKTPNTATDMIQDKRWLEEVQRSSMERHNAFIQLLMCLQD